MSDGQTIFNYHTSWLNHLQTPFLLGMFRLNHLQSPFLCWLNPIKPHFSWLNPCSPCGFCSIHFRQAAQGRWDRHQHHRSLQLWGAMVVEHQQADAENTDHAMIIGFIMWLVGGLEHEFYDFPFSWECHHPNWRTHIFRRGGQPPTSIGFIMCVLRYDGIWMSDTFIAIVFMDIHGDYKSTYIRYYRI